MSKKCVLIESSKTSAGKKCVLIQSTKGAAAQSSKAPLPQSPRPAILQQKKPLPKNVSQTFALPASSSNSVWLCWVNILIA